MFSVYNIYIQYAYNIMYIYIPNVTVNVERIIITSDNVRLRRVLLAQGPYTRYPLLT